MDDLISRKAAIDALWKALFEYEDKTEKQYQESDELDIGDWFQHRIFVQNMSDIDIQTILNLPSAQPTQKNDSNTLDALDCVSRQAVIDACMRVRELRAYDEIEEIQALPSAQPKHGRWIKMSDADGIYYACSECGEELTRIEKFDSQFDLFPRLKSIDKTYFCPNCGARMGGENNEVD